MPRYRIVFTAVVLLSLAACTMTQSARLMARPEGTRFIEVGIESAAETAIVDRARLDEVARGFEGVVNHSPLHAPVPVPRNLKRELLSLRDCLLEGWPNAPAAPELVVGSNLAPGAEAVPGRVTLYTGLLAQEEMSGGQIAFVLAHELAHVLLGHYNRVEFQEGQKTAMGALASAGVLASVAAATQIDNTGGRVTVSVGDESQLKEHLLYVSLAAQASQLLLDGFIESSWSRDQEIEADLLGVDLIANGGIFYTNAPAALRFLEQYQKNRTTNLEEYSSVAEAQMERAVQDGQLEGVATALVEVFAGGLRAAWSDVTAVIQRSQISATARIESIGDYNEEIYEELGVEPFIVGGRCDVARLDAILERDPMQPVYDALLAAQEANKAVLVEDLAAARRHVRNALRGPVRNHPVTRYAAYGVAKVEGNDQRAIDHLRSVRRGPETPIVVYTTLGRELLVNGRPVEARQVLVEGANHYPEDAFYPLRLQVAYVREDERDIERVSNQCAASGLEAIRRACANVARELGSDGAGAETGGPIGGFFETLRQAGEQLTQ